MSRKRSKKTNKWHFYVPWAIIDGYNQSQMILMIWIYLNAMSMIQNGPGLSKCGKGSASVSIREFYEYLGLNGKRIASSFVTEYLEAVRFIFNKGYIYQADILGDELKEKTRRDSAIRRNYIISLPSKKEETNFIAPHAAMITSRQYFEIENFYKQLGSSADSKDGIHKKHILYFLYCYITAKMTWRGNKQKLENYYAYTFYLDVLSKTLGISYTVVRHVCKFIRDKRLLLCVESSVYLTNKGLKHSLTGFFKPNDMHSRDVFKRLSEEGYGQNKDYENNEEVDQPIEM